MAYSTQADILLRFPAEKLIGMTDDARTGAIDPDVVTAAIAKADAEIDGYVGARHDVPLDPVPDLVKSISVSLAIYNLHLRRPGLLQDDVTAEHDNAVRLLAAISKGTVSLGVSDPSGTPPNSNTPVVATANPPRQLSRDKLRRF